MVKIKAMLPIYASAKFECEKPDNWDEMTDYEKKEYFAENMYSISSLCHQCSGPTETDYEANLDYYDKDVTAEDCFWEEE